MKDNKLVCKIPPASRVIFFGLKQGSDKFQIWIEHTVKDILDFTREDILFEHTYVTYQTGDKIPVNSIYKFTLIENHLVYHLYEE